MAPRTAVAKKIQRTLEVPILALSWLKTSEERMAPHLPHAAERPCAVARILVGNDSAATMTTRTLVFFLYNNSNKGTHMWWCWHQS
jgi:hypothetical protein